MKEEKIFRRKYSVDTLTDTATVDFNFASWSGESKKNDNNIEVDKRTAFFLSAIQ